MNQEPYVRSTNSMLMGSSKNNIHAPMYQEMALQANALAHPARIAILEHLVKQDACICTDLSEKIGLAQATISQHLKVLRRSGLIKGSIQGAKTCYCVDVSRWAEVGTTFRDFFAKDPTEHLECHPDKDLMK